MSDTLARLAHENSGKTGHPPVVAGLAENTGNSNLIELAKMFKVDLIDFGSDRHVSSIMRVTIDDKGGFIKPFQYSSTIPLNQLSPEQQERIGEAYHKVGPPQQGQLPQYVEVISVILLADKEEDFKGANFRIVLDTSLKSEAIQQHSKQASPTVGVTTALPSGYQKDFFKSDWSTKKGADSTRVSFSFGKSRDGKSHLHDYGIISSKNIIGQCGGSEQLSSSSATDVLIPFGARVTRPQDTALTLSHGSHGLSQDVDLETDYPGAENVVDGPGGGSVVPIPLNTQTRYEVTHKPLPTHEVVHKAGLLILRTATQNDFNFDQQLAEYTAQSKQLAACTALSTQLNQLREKTIKDIANKVIW